MSTTTRVRKHRPLNGIPTAGGPTETQSVAGWWEAMRIYALATLTAAALGCGAGSQQPSSTVTGVWVVPTETGPLQIIAIKKGGGK